jgi:hypothetical protein
MPFRLIIAVALLPEIILPVDPVAGRIVSVFVADAPVNPGKVTGKVSTLEL